jgi:predicted transcriptional regulator
MGTLYSYFMNKTTVEVFQEMIRNKNFSVEGTAKKFNKAKTTIYDNLSIIKHILQNDQLTKAYKTLFLTYPYDFSFLTKNNLTILFLLENEISFTEIIKKSKKSRFTVNNLLRHLKQRGFINKKNKIILLELLDLLKIIKKYQKNDFIKLPNTAVMIDQNGNRDLIQATTNTNLQLKKTAFSAMNIISPYNYYTTKKKVMSKDIFLDAKLISKTKREELITALFYKKEKIKKDPKYENIINTKEFKEFEKENE